MEESKLNMPLLVDDFPNLEDAKKNDYRNMVVLPQKVKNNLEL